MDRNTFLKFKLINLSLVLWNTVNMMLKPTQSKVTVLDLLQFLKWLHTTLVMEKCNQISMVKQECDQIAGWNRWLLERI